MAKVWNADLPITEVDEVGRTFTAFSDDPNIIIMVSPWLVDSITVTWHLADGADMPVTEQSVILFKSKVAGS